MPCKLIVGLGNPGKEYQNTWHNAGFWVIDNFAQRKNCSFKKGYGNFLVAADSKSENFLLLKPTVYMNLSGIAVYQAIRYYKIRLEDLLIIYDDHDLPLGMLRLRSKGSDGGHKGVKSIIEHLNTKDFPRMRIGIRTRESETKQHLVNTVLSAPPKELEEIVKQVIVRASDAIECFLEFGIEKAMNIFNERKRKPADDNQSKENSSASPEVK